MCETVPLIRCILYRLKNIFPENVLFVLYNSLIVLYINYGLLLWGGGGGGEGNSRL